MCKISHGPEALLQLEVEANREEGKIIWYLITQSSESFFNWAWTYGLHRKSIETKYVINARKQS